MPDRRSIFRLLALAGFLLTVALALWLAEVRPLVVVVVMALALLVAWTVEWLSWRQELPRPAAAGPEHERASLPADPPAPAFASEAGAEEAPAQPEPLAAPPPPEPAAAPVAALPAPAPPPEPEPAAAAAEEPDPPAAAPEPEPSERPRLRPVPPPPPAPAPPAEPEPAPEPVPAAAARPDVVDLRTHLTASPRRWNLWDLERRARDEAQRHPARYEEWSYLFVHLRQFATPDGSLPTEFDGLVRESFGELLERAG
ncbi:MAG TPA: hypothetical protein VD704_03010 [Gaiellaceae bacterium]|nr:hypothetical protein [Gaiellaceae bacterium]